jgi:hypothetical protein
METSTPPLARLAAALALATALAACGHARQAPLVRSPTEDAPAERGEPAPMAAASPEAPAMVIANSGEPGWPPNAAPTPWTTPRRAGGDAGRATRAPPGGPGAPVIADSGAPARPAPTRPPPVRDAGDGAGRGAMEGLGVVLYATGVLCFGGGPITLILCAAALSEFWPAYLAITVGAMAIGAAASATASGVSAPERGEDPAGPAFAAPDPASAIPLAQEAPPTG